MIKHYRTCITSKAPDLTTVHYFIGDTEIDRFFAVSGRIKSEAEAKALLAKVYADVNGRLSFGEAFLLDLCAEQLDLVVSPTEDLN